VVKTLDNAVGATAVNPTFQTPKPHLPNPKPQTPNPNPKPKTQSPNPQNPNPTPGVLLADGWGGGRGTDVPGRAGGAPVHGAAGLAVYDGFRDHQAGVAGACQLCLRRVD